jgi:hypothetical protein
VASPDDPGAGGLPPPSSMSPVVRGCLIAGAFGLFLACVAGSVLAYSCMGLVSMGTSQFVHELADAYRASAARAGEESTYDADLRRLVIIGDAGQISLVSFGILSNRYQDARRDGIIDTDELHHGMELIHDVVIGDGEVRIEQYPTGR